MRPVVADTVDGATVIGRVPALMQPVDPRVIYPSLIYLGIYKRIKRSRFNSVWHEVKTSGKELSCRIQCVSFESEASMRIKNYGLTVKRQFIIERNIRCKQLERTATRFYVKLLP